MLYYENDMALNGEELEAYALYDGWILVKSSNGNYRWADADFFKIISEETPVVTEAAPEALPEVSPEAPVAEATPITQ